jgi:putative addiction module CopG family antidote
MRVKSSRHANIEKSMALKITLPPELARFVRQELKGGGYKLASDVLIAGLRLLQKTDRAANLAIGDLNGTGIPEGADIEGLAFVAGDKRPGCRLESNYGSDQCKKMSVGVLFGTPNHAMPT